MTSTKPKRTSWLKSFATFSSHFFHTCFVLRGVLGVQVLLVLSGGLSVAFFERLSAWEGIYFAIITSTSVGYGDIQPTTTISQAISMALALVGTIFFGLVVATATRAVTVTVQDYRDAQGAALPNSAASN